MKWSSSDWLAVAAFALGGLLVSAERAQLAEQHRQLTSKHDAYLLPPPQQAVVLSLGYRAAAADLIFGHVLVSAGIHLSEKRLFEFAGQYLETVNELDPKFRDAYAYADGILTLQTVRAPDEMFRKARDILLRGTRELPYDQRLWTAAGQFLAYVAPPALHDPAEGRAFRLEGARLLAHACELIGSDENIPYHCVTAAAIFSEAGNDASARASLEKLRIISNNDPELHKLIDGQLDLLRGKEVRRDLQQHAQRYESTWRDDLPFLSHEGFAALGPRFDPAACAGARPQAADDVCATALRERLAPPERSDD